MAADNLVPEKIIYNLLKTLPYVGSAPVPVFQNVITDWATTPIVSYQRVATRYDYTLQGRSQYTIAVFRVDVWAESEVMAGDIATNVHAILDGKKQGVAEGQALFIMGANDISLFEAEEKVHRRSMVFEVQFRDFSS
jgi:hypothetical protein